MRQWCLYWKERQPLPPPTQPHHQAGGPGAASDAARGRGSVAPVAAAGGGASSADDGGNMEMDDEADSAFVHQGWVQTEGAAGYPYIPRHFSRWLQWVFQFGGGRRRGSVGPVGGRVYVRLDVVVFATMGSTHKKKVSEISGRALH